MKTQVCKVCEQEKLDSDFYIISGYLRKDCKDCHNKSSLKRRKDKRQGLKRKAVNYLGGKCCKCGYNKCIQALEFNHKEIENKQFSISIGCTIFKWKDLKKELDKCELLCSNCHREFTVLQLKW